MLGKVLRRISQTLSPYDVAQFLEVYFAGILTIFSVPTSIVEPDIIYYMIKYGYTILYVDNVEEAITFYIKAFGFTQKLLTPEKDYAELETGDTTLAFASHSVAEYNGVAITKSDPSSSSPAFEITFVTDDIKNAFNQAVGAGAVVVKQPEQKPWGQKVGYVKDINGFLIEICTPIK